MKGLDFLMRKKLHEESSTSECVIECINIADYYNRFVARFTKPDYPCAGNQDLADLVECFKKALEEQGFELEDGLRYDDAKDAESAVIELTRAILRDYANDNPDELKSCDACKCLKTYEPEERCYSCAEHGLCEVRRCMQYESGCECEGDKTPEELIELEKKIVITLFRLTNELTHLSFDDMMTEIIQGNEWEPKIPWSFDVFGDAIDYARVENLSTMDIETVWETCFDTFMEYADHESLMVLKRGCNPTPTAQVDEQWADYLYEFLEDEGVVKFCPQLLIKDIMEMFPEMSTMILETLFVALMNGEYDAITMADLLRVMAEYQNYRNNFFACCQKQYKKIISIVMCAQNVSTMGTELNEISEILVETFKVPAEDIESAIRLVALDMMGCTSKSNYELLPENAAKLVHLLNNKAVYDVVDEYKPQIIDQFI